MFAPARGFNAIYLPWEKMSYPNNASPGPGEPELSFDELCRRLAVAGVNRLRVKFVGWNGPLGTSARSFEYAIEDGKSQYNDWGGRLPALVAACKAHGVGLQAIVFDNEEFRTGWSAHAWNVVNGGFLSDPRDALSDPRAIEAGKRRIDAIVERAGAVVDAWEICAEMTFMMTAEPDGFWPTDWAGLKRITNEIAGPWVETMVQYIHGLHDAPVGNGQVHGDPAAPRNGVYKVPSLDFALINWYGASNLGAQVRRLREVQAEIGKPVYVEQYAPWAIGSATSPEPPNMALSKAIEFAAACGEYGMVGPLRWPEIRPKGEGGFKLWWGVGHPNMDEMAGITAQMAGAVDLADWSYRGEAWDERIESQGVQFVSSWGDGAHVTAFVEWSAQGTYTVRVSGLVSQAYEVRLYDYLTGDLAGTLRAYAEINEGSITLDNVLARDGRLAFYVAPTGGEPPVDPPVDETPVWDEARIAALEEQVEQANAKIADLTGQLEAQGERLERVEQAAQVLFERQNAAAVALGGG